MDIRKIFAANPLKHEVGGAVESKQTKAFSSLGNRNFRLLWIGGILSHIGDEMQMISVSWLVMLITNSPLLMGVTSLFQGLPRLIFGVVGGLIADRQSRQKLLILYTSSQTVVAFLFAFLVLSGHIKYWHILVLLPFFGFFQAVYAVCRQAYLYDLVGKDDLMNALAVHSSGMNFAKIIGPSIAGIIIGIWGVGWCILINAISFIAILISIFMMNPPQECQKRNGAGNTVIKDLGETFTYLTKNTTILLLLLITFLFVIFGLQVQVIIPLFARNILHVGASGYGFLISAMGGGALLGGIVMASMGDFNRKGYYLLVTAILYGTLLILFSLSHWFYASLLLIFFVGTTDMLSRTLNQTLVQLHVSNELRGRVLGVYMLDRGFKPLGGFLMGAGASVLGAPLALSIGAGLCVFFALGLLIKDPRIREL